MFKYEFPNIPAESFPAGANLMIRVFTHTGRDPSWHYALHVHSNATEFMYVAKGAADIVLERQRVTVRAGDVLLIGSGVAHSTSFHEGEPCDIWTLSATNVEPDGQYGRMVSVHTEAGRHRQFIEETMARIKIFTGEMDVAAQAACNYLAASLFALFRHKMIPPAAQPGKRRKTLAGDVLQYINEHYSQDITLPLLAETFFVSASHLSREFKQAHGISPLHYLIDRRLSDANWMLLKTAEPVHTVAEKVGYRNPYYFIKLFTGRVGYSPLGYREKYGLPGPGERGSPE